MIDYLNYGKQVQSIPKKPQSKIKVCTPKSSHGWLEYKLNQTELDYVWSCVNHQEVEKNNWSHNLAGNISNSYLLEDKNNWFYNNTIVHLIDLYEKSFENLGKGLAFSFHSQDGDSVSYAMKPWWVNYQKQYDFNPSHNHDGIYSFVIWLKIPYEWEEQNKDNKSREKLKGSFLFEYTSMVGECREIEYKLGKKYEGTMLFFPSKLNHTVFPYYNCEEDRISISGNILLEV